ncbi:properdin-like isoform 2-T2 [Menidia menidia]
MEPCTGTCCDGKDWDPWLPWSPCSVTCGGVGVRKRSRVCSRPPECRAACTGSADESEKCESSNKCPVHGLWSSWSDWATCTGTCVDGDRVPSRTRRRSCSSPAPSTDTAPHGRSCPGDGAQTQPCSELPNCPVDGNWGAWSAPGACSVTCGPGLKLSNRKCDNPAPKYGGKICEGPSTQSSECQSPCPVHGLWTGWSPWSECSSSCIPPGKIPSRTRRRSCTNPAPSSAPPGQACPGQPQEAGNCDFLPHCPVNGGWGQWSAFSTCPVTCGVGLQVSTRQCNSPAPNHGGASCPGEGRKTKTCLTKTHCPVDGVWSEWSEWGACTYPFGNKDIRCKTIGGSQNRERECRYRDHGGAYCVGDDLTQTRVCYDVDNCSKLKGTWGGWLEWKNCNPLCGEKSRRFRFLECIPDYSEYSPTIGRKKEKATFSGSPKPDCGDLPDGKKKYELQDCKNAPPC